MAHNQEKIFHFINLQINANLKNVISNWISFLKVNNNFTGCSVWRETCTYWEYKT